MLWDTLMDKGFVVMVGTILVYEHGRMAFYWYCVRVGTKIVPGLERVPRMSERVVRGTPWGGGGGGPGR